MIYEPLFPQRSIVVDAIYSVHYFEYACDFSFPGEFHPFWEIVYVDKGTVDITAGDRLVKLTAGQAILHPPNEFHAISAADGTAPDLVVVSFSVQGSGMDHLWSRIVPIDADERACLGRIVEESGVAFSTPLNDIYAHRLDRREQTPFGTEQRITAALEELLIQLVRQQLGVPDTVSIPPDDQWMAAMDEYLKARLDRPLTIEQICRDNLIGRSQLQKRFHDLTGGGVMAYFSKLKIQMARRLIREGNLNVTQIAASLGYQSVHYFSRHFKQHTGMSPSQYAKSVKMLSGLPGSPMDDRLTNG